MSFILLYSQSHLEGRICILKIAAYPDGAVIQCARLKYRKQIQMQNGHAPLSPFFLTFTFCILLTHLITHHALYKRQKRMRMLEWEFVQFTF